MASCDGLEGFSVRTELTPNDYYGNHHLSAHRRRCRLARGGFGLVGDIVVGVIGSFIGGWLFSLLGIAAGGLIGAIIAAVVGAIILIAILRLIKRA